MRILVIEDEPKVARALNAGLQRAGYEVSVSATGEEGFFAASAQAFDLILLDLMLPGRDGLEVLGTLRRRGVKTPVLILTARDTVEDRVQGLDGGADDYLVKPFALVELLARVRALTRRQGGVGVQGTLSAGTLELDRLQRAVRRGTRTIPLAPRQFRLLEYLMLQAGRPVSRSELLREVWNLTFDPDSNLVDAHISTLRSAIETGGEPRLIHTVRGVGYTLRADPS